MCTFGTNLEFLSIYVLNWNQLKKFEGSGAKPPRKYCTWILYAKTTDLNEIIYVFSWNQLKHFDLPFCNQLKILKPFEHIDLDFSKGVNWPFFFIFRAKYIKCWPSTISCKTSFCLSKGFFSKDLYSWLFLSRNEYRRCVWVVAS